MIDNHCHEDNVLRWAQEQQREVAARGWDWPTLEGVLDKIAEELGEVRQAVASGDRQRAAEELGDLLLAATHACNRLDADATELLARAMIKLLKRLAKADEWLIKEGKVARTCAPETLDQAWNTVKSLEF
ncbi:MAG TPA: MazG nucleotide pyrophosphohydrolase domain-containing protein [Candidatus Hydrogenedentes bacterium]|nr:MazG nucleotide pyrophosphohydrolase domain-containing protein [Candidatus Hydrogenedentota bacterium]